MKIAKAVLAITLAAGAMVSGAALADRGHSRVVFGINLGVPIAPWYYPPYYPYPPVVAMPVYPGIVAAQSSPPAYIEKGGDGQPATSSNYWYYCPDAQGYYPYVTECRSGWLTVLPQAPVQPGPR